MWVAECGFGDWYQSLKGVCGFGIASPFVENLLSGNTHRYPETYGVVITSWSTRASS